MGEDSGAQKEAGPLEFREGGVGQSEFAKLPCLFLSLRYQEAEGGVLT